MPQKNFAASVTDWVREVEARATAVFRASTEEVVSEMQKVGPSVASTKAAIEKGVGATGRGKARKQKFGPVAPAGEGGNLPVDTGYLRASVRASKDRPVPIDKGARPAEGKTYSHSPGSVALVINGAGIGETIYVTYTASYAAAVNYGSRGRSGYHFVDLAAMRWPQIVSANCARLQSMSGGSSTPGT